MAPSTPTASGTSLRLAAGPVTHAGAAGSALQALHGRLVEVLAVVGQEERLQAFADVDGPAQVALADALVGAEETLLREPIAGSPVSRASSLWLPGRPRTAGSMTAVPGPVCSLRATCLWWCP